MPGLRRCDAVALVEQDQRGVKVRQDLVVQDAAHLAVGDLALSPLDARQVEQASRQRGRRLQVQQARAGGAGDGNLLIGVEAIAAAPAKQQDADLPLPAMQGQRPGSIRAMRKAQKVGCPSVEPRQH